MNKLLKNLLCLYIILIDFEGRNCNMKYVCKICGYVYDPKNNDGIEFKDLEEDWICPLCGATKDDFVPMEEEK